MDFTFVYLATLAVAMWSTGAIVGTSIGAVVGMYGIAVLVLYAFPSLLHKRKPRLFDGVLLAHRGGAAERLENTMEAFRHAIEDTQADILELDLHLTKDKQIVITHDSDLERTTGVRGVIVEDTDFDKLPPYKQHLEVTFKPGYSVPDEQEDTRIPLLEELLQRFPNAKLNMDLKNGTQELVQKTAELLRRYDRTQTVIWGSSVNRVLELCYEHDPTIPLYFSFGRVAKLMVFFYTGLLAFMPIREEFYELPYASPALKNQMEEQGRMSLGVRFASALLDVFLLNRCIISYLRRRGVETYVFVVNDEEGWRTMYERGVAGVHTDVPSKLRQFLDANPQYAQRIRADGGDVEHSGRGEKDRLVPPPSKSGDL